MQSRGAEEVDKQYKRYLASKARRAANRAAKRAKVAADQARTRAALQADLHHATDVVGNAASGALRVASSAADVANAAAVRATRTLGSAIDTGGHVARVAAVAAGDAGQTVARVAGDVSGLLHDAYAPAVKAVARATVSAGRRAAGALHGAAQFTLRSLRAEWDRRVAEAERRQFIREHVGPEPTEPLRYRARTPQIRELQHQELLRRLDEEERNEMRHQQELARQRRAEQIQRLRAYHPPAPPAPPPQPPIDIARMRADIERLRSFRPPVAEPAPPPPAPAAPPPVETGDMNDNHDAIGNTGAVTGEQFETLQRAGFLPPS